MPNKQIKYLFGSNKNRYLPNEFIKYFVFHWKQSYSERYNKLLYLTHIVSATFAEFTFNISFSFITDVFRTR